MWRNLWYHTSRAGIWTVGICQLTKRFDPNSGVFISGNDLHAYKASTICTCYNGGGGGGGGKVNKGGGGKVNKGGGGKVKVIIECAIILSDPANQSRQDLHLLM